MAACCLIAAVFIHRLITAFESVHGSSSRTPSGSSGSKEEGCRTRHTEYTELKCEIGGIECQSCVSTLEKELSALHGVYRVAISFPLGRATIVYMDSVLSAATITKTIEGLGFTVRPHQRPSHDRLEDLHRVRDLRGWRGSFRRCLGLAIGCAAARLSAPEQYEPLVQQAIFVVGAWIHLVEARRIHRNAWAKAGRVGVYYNMDLLTSLSLLAGMGLCLFDIWLNCFYRALDLSIAGSWLTAAICGSRYVDLLLRRRTVSGLSTLYQLGSQTEMVTTMPGRVSKPAVCIRPDDEILVEPAGVVPCDCYIIEGSSLVDQSHLTGEVRPDLKHLGDLLPSGSKNLSHPVRALVVRSQSESSLQQLIDSISTVTEKRSEQPTSIEFLTIYFVKVMIFLSFLAFTLTYLYSSSIDTVDRIHHACTRAMTVLAAACPCALGLAIPSAIMAGIDAGLRCGFIFTGGARALERLADVTYCMFDKTGTLTTGVLAVNELSIRDEKNKTLSMRELCMLLCAAERSTQATHPIGRAVFRWALAQLSVDERVKQSRALVWHASIPLGKGVSCKVKLPDTDDRRSVLVGTSELLREYHTGFTDDQAGDDADMSVTRVFIAIDGQYLGYLTLSDEMRPGMRDTIVSLQERNIRFAMLTGDVPEEAKRISRLTGAPVLAAQRAPQQKQETVESLQHSGEVVAMVGDGLNDLPAQSAADVGISVSHSWCLQADEAADIIMMPLGLTHLPWLSDIARKVRHQSRLNVAWALGYNLLTVSLALGAGERWGLGLTPATAGSMMGLSNLVVLGASLRLRSVLYTGQQQ